MTETARKFFYTANCAPLLRGVCFVRLKAISNFWGVP